MRVIHELDATISVETHMVRPRQIVTWKTSGAVFEGIASIVRIVDLTLHLVDFIVSIVDLALQLVGCCV